MVYSLVSVAVNIVLGVALFFTIGFQGIALSTTIASWITVLQMVLKLRRDGHWSPSPRAANKIVRVVAASLCMGMLLALASHFRAAIEAPLIGLHAGGAKEVAVLLVAAFGAAAYAVMLFAFGGVTPAEVRSALRRRKGDRAAPADDAA